MLRLRLTLLLLIPFHSIASEDIQSIDVIAIEYPPFTTISQPNGGTAFEILNNISLDKKLKWHPIFLPPKRAYKVIESGDWCASFYPIFGQSKYTQYELNDKVIKIGLVRLSGEKPFTWSSLSELSGKSVALLRTGSNSDFEKRFKQAGLDIAYVETVQSAIQMVLLERVDTAMIDNISYSYLETKNKEKLQLSESSLIETKINIFINNKCNISLPESKIIKSQN